MYDTDTFPVTEALKSEQECNKTQRIQCLKRQTTATKSQIWIKDIINVEQFE